MPPALYGSGEFRFSRFRPAFQAGAERQVALQEKYEIEDLHPPPDGKGGTDVSGQDGIYRRRQLETLRRGGENLDEFGSIPRVHKAQVHIHRPMHLTLVLAKEACSFFWPIQGGVDCLRAQLPGMNRPKKGAR